MRNIDLIYHLYFIDLKISNYTLYKNEFVLNILYSITKKFQLKDRANT